MHKNKKITLLPLSPADIRKHFNEFAANDKKTPPSNDSCDAQTNGIKLKTSVYITTTFAAAVLCDNFDAPCYTMLCRDMCFINNDPMPHILHPVVTKLLQEFDARMESRTTPIQEGGMMRTSPRWTCTNWPHLQVTSRLQLGLHVHLGFSQHPCTVSAISPSYGVRMR